MMWVFRIDAVSLTSLSHNFPQEVEAFSDKWPLTATGGQYSALDNQMVLREQQATGQYVVFDNMTGSIQSAEVLMPQVKRKLGRILDAAHSEPCFT